MQEIWTEGGLLFLTKRLELSRVSCKHGFQAIRQVANSINRCRTPDQNQYDYDKFFEYTAGQLSELLTTLWQN